MSKSFDFKDGLNGSLWLLYHAYRTPHERINIRPKVVYIEHLANIPVELQRSYTCITTIYSWLADEFELLNIIHFAEQFWL
jgi:hypothetical protein